MKEYEEGDMFDVSGWGNTQGTVPPTTMLQIVKVPYVTDAGKVIS
jgi:hypothetical protein